MSYQSEERYVSMKEPGADRQEVNRTVVGSSVNGVK